MNYRKVLTCLAVSLAAMDMSAQSTTIHGKVVDNEGLEVIGATISSKVKKVWVLLPTSMVTLP